MRENKGSYRICQWLGTNHALGTSACAPFELGDEHLAINPNETQLLHLPSIIPVAC